ncbi:MAG: peroxiredoxin [Paraglaciecola psychrophila]
MHLILTPDHDKKAGNKMKATNITSRRLSADPLYVVSVLRAVATVALVGLLTACGQVDPAVTAAKAPDHSAMAHAQITEQADPLASDDTIVGMQVDDFQLVDHTGATQRLYKSDKAPAIVLMTQGNGCPIVRTSMPSMHKISEKYAALGITFFLLNSNIQDNQNSISEEVAEFGYNLPVLVDQYQRVGESLNVTRTAEVFVINPATRKVVYHGPIDDRVGYENQRKTASHEYLIDALDNVLAGEKVAVSSVDAPGCLINFPDRSMKDKHAAIVYRDTNAQTL